MTMSRELERNLLLVSASTMLDFFEGKDDKWCLTVEESANNLADFLKEASLGIVERFNDNCYAWNEPRDKLRLLESALPRIKHMSALETYRMLISYSRRTKGFARGARFDKEKREEMRNFYSSFVKHLSNGGRPNKLFESSEYKEI